jgi:hypothetical protein
MSLPIPSGSLHRRTLELVRSVPRSTTLSQIAEATDLPLGWLSAFSRDEIKAPNVNRVQILFEHLSGRKLEVE